MSECKRAQEVVPSTYRTILGKSLSTFCVSLWPHLTLLQGFVEICVCELKKSEMAFAHFVHARENMRTRGGSIDLSLSRVSPCQLCVCLRRFTHHHLLIIINVLTAKGGPPHPHAPRAHSFQEERKKEDTEGGMGVSEGVQLGWDRPGHLLIIIIIFLDHHLFMHRYDRRWDGISIMVSVL